MEDQIWPLTMSRNMDMGLQDPTHMRDPSQATEMLVAMLGPIINTPCTFRHRGDVLTAPDTHRLKSRGNKSRPKGIRW
jgi:hypothetical protein